MVLDLQYMCFDQLLELNLFPRHVCLLVEQYIVTVVRGIEVRGLHPYDEARILPRTTIIGESVMAGVINGEMVDAEVLEGMQLLIQQKFPNVLGFQPMYGVSDRNLYEEFKRGETIFQILYVVVNDEDPHWCCCFAKQGTLYYICSLNQKPSPDLEQRLALMFCEPNSQSPITAQFIRVERQQNLECGCRTATAGALLCFGMGVDEFSRVIHPPLKQMYEDLRHCLVEGHWLPRWAVNPKLRPNPYKRGKAFEIKLRLPGESPAVSAGKKNKRKKTKQKKRKKTKTAIVIRDPPCNCRGHKSIFQSFGSSDVEKCSCKGCPCSPANIQHKNKLTVNLIIIIIIIIINITECISVAYFTHA